MTKDLDMDTLTAYSHYLHGRIKEQLNSLSIGPGRFYYLSAMALFFLGLICMIVGILVITLRHRHIYLINFDYKFLGPGFIVIFILCFGIGTHLLVHAKEITNKYRRKLRFRALGEYGVAVLHISQIQKKEKQRYDLKSGHLQHVVSPTPRGMSRHTLGSIGDVSRQSYRSEKSRASSQDSIDKQTGRNVRGRRDPHFQSRIRDSDIDDKSDGSRSRDTRDGRINPDERLRGAPRGAFRGVPRGVPRSVSRGMPRGAPRGMHPYGEPPPFDHGYQPQGFRGNKGGQMRFHYQPGNQSYRKERIDYDPRGYQTQAQQSSRQPTSSDDSRDIKVDTSSESEI